MAAGHGIVVLPLSTAVFYTRPGVAYSHVSDIPPNQVCLAWVRRTGSGPRCGVQPGRAAARHRQRRQDGAGVGLTWRP